LDNRVDLQGISSRLKQIRHRLELTPNQIFQRTGISTGNLSELENGKYPPSAKTLILLSELYGISIDWILKGETHPRLNERPVPDSPPPLIADPEISCFFKKIAEMWTQGDRDIRGWIVVQLRLAFPQIAGEIKKEQEKAATTEIA
jgi:transcriptional regulator with XRE-family HTH domain